ncbi:flavin mononucleotide hydrolase 1, chloroplatic [Telopea speciosissima]|uniref:flavin mononucleotide hydrolase 1, chloroplatic n=1 Tax=Telopea speciosissima TaxID=54955 RepID=UPI001CC79534|nr:flavin mononucleotide hydrolase 1, chloroplatic [Telopea speciosissima]
MPWSPLMALFLRPTLLSVRPTPTLKSVKIAHSMKPSFSSSSSEKSKLPILLFDVMDTIVRDPFYEDVPGFFRMTLKELIECKHPTAWIEFEEGRINEMELAGKFFKDGRSFDMEGLKECMRRGYSYIDGVEELLRSLKKNNYEIHAFTNYPIWYTMIEDKLNISTYLSWTFCSCVTGKRKPAADFYWEALRHLEVEPASCVFIDDRMANVEAAVNVGMVGLHFKDSVSLQHDLSILGIEIDSPADKCHQKLDPAILIKEPLS